MKAKKQIKRGRPARAGYALLKDREATQKYGIRMLKWVPVASSGKEAK